MRDDHRRRDPGSPECAASGSVPRALANAEEQPVFERIGQLLSARLQGDPGRPDGVVAVKGGWAVTPAPPPNGMRRLQKGAKLRFQILPNRVLDVLESLCLGRALRPTAGRAGARDGEALLGLPEKNLVPRYHGSTLRRIMRPASGPATASADTRTMPWEEA